jgi:hypothetical protein
MAGFALERLRAITESLPSCADPERLEAIAGTMPQRVGELAAEVGLALAELALALAEHGPRLPDDLDSLGPRVQVAWLRVRLSIVEASDPLEAIDETMLLRALAGWSLLDVAHPIALLRRMARAADPRLRAAALEHLRPALHDLAITPDHACECLLRMAEDPEPSVRRDAFAGLLASPPSRISPPLRVARERLVRAGLDDADLEIVRTCVTLAAADAGGREWLVELAFDGSCEGARRVAAIEGLGPLARAEDLAPVLELAIADPLRYGGCVRGFVLAAHRRGVFLREAHVPALLAAFDSHEGWTGDLLIRVAHIARVRLVALLAELPAQDRRWLRRAAILAAAVDTDAHLSIATLLRSTSDLRIARALIDAAGRSPDYADEHALLAWLPVLPEPVIAVLRVKGGEAAALRLRALVEDHTCPADVRTRALAALWALARDRAALLRELCERVGPHAAGLLESTPLFARAPVAAAILDEAPWPDAPEHAIDPLAALGLLCESGEIELLPAVTRRFRVLFTDYVREALAGDFTIKRVRMPALEQLIYRYGRHMIARGRSVRRWIDDTPDTGRELILAIAIDWLREHPPAPVCVALLETIARQQPTGVSLRQIEEFWRHPEAEVQRAALEAIVAAGEAARGLELSIGRLTNASDPRILRQALAGVATLSARWAEPMVIAALARPEMAVKKEAADALAIVGSLRSVPTLVEWLGIHDNASFRAGLLAALQAIAGKGVLAVLVDAIDDADEPRRRALLREALSGIPSLRATLRLGRSQQPARLEIVEAALAGELRLVDASAEQLAAALHRAKLRTLPERDDPTRRLRLEGFSPDAALALLDARDAKRDPAILAMVRSGFADWLRWLTHERAPNAVAELAALQLVLEAAMPAHTEHFEPLLDLAEPAVTRIEPRILAGFVERCLTDPARPITQRARGLAILRAIPCSAEVGGLRRWSLLAKLGAVRDARDLERCLAECRIGSDLATQSERLLLEAFAIPPARHDEVQRLGVTEATQLEALRERAKTWFRSPAAEAEAWLTTMLATHPLDLPALAPPPRPEHERPKPTFVPSSSEDLASLLAIVHGPDSQARDRAAERILAWPDARSIADSWMQVLTVYLAGDIEPSRDAKAKLASLLEAWPQPTSETHRARARALIEFLDLDQRRRFLPVWIADWERGEPEAETLLRSIDPELLIPHARARAAANEFALVRLLHRSGSLALRELVEFVGARAPNEVAHLLADTPAREPASVTSALADPIANRQPDALVALIRDRNVAIGLAVRAIHALTEFESRGADAIEPFTLDRRPQIRSAALRALRKVAPRERTASATVRVLEIETRRDVITSLMASIGHARYLPGLPRLLAYLIDSDPKLRESAREALLAWGRDVVPELHRAARKARPDRRPIFEALIATLEHHDRDR